MATINSSFSIYDEHHLNLLTMTLLSIVKGMILSTDFFSNSGCFLTYFSKYLKHHTMAVKQKTRSHCRVKIKVHCLISVM